MKNLFIILTILFGLLRFILPSSGQINQEDIFKDLAHIYVGVLFGLGYQEKFYRYLAYFITILEIIAFFSK